MEHSKNNTRCGTPSINSHQELGDNEGGGGLSWEAVVPVGRRWFQSGGGGGPVRCPCPGPPGGPHPLSPTSWERGSLLCSASQFPKFHDLKTAQLCPNSLGIRMLRTQPPCCEDAQSHGQTTCWCPSPSRDQLRSQPTSTARYVSKQTFRKC